MAGCQEHQDVKQRRTYDGNNMKKTGKLGGMLITVSNVTLYFLTPHHLRFQGEIQGEEVLITENSVVDISWFSPTYRSSGDHLPRLAPVLTNPRVIQLRAEATLRMRRLTEDLREEHRMRCAAVDKLNHYRHKESQRSRSSRPSTVPTLPSWHSGSQVRTPRTFSQRGSVTFR